MIPADALRFLNHEALLCRDRDSHEFGELLTDATDAGEIVARTRTEIEQRLEKSIVEAGNHRGWWAGRRRRRWWRRVRGSGPRRARFWF